MKRHQIKEIWNTGTCLIIFFIGVLFFLQRWISWILLYISTILFSFARAVSIMLDHYDGTHPRSPQDSVRILFHIAFGLSLIIIPASFEQWTHVFFGWWIIDEAIIHFMNWLAVLRDHLKGHLSLFLRFLILTGFGIFLLFDHNAPIKTEIISVILGVYFLFYGLVTLFNSIWFRYPDSSLFHKIRFSIPLPILFNAFIPIRTYEALQNTDINTDSEAIPDCDLEVFIYLKGTGFESFGHIDIAYKGKVYSYGAHDPQNRKVLGTFGDGVLIVCERESFLKTSIENERRTVIGYGIRLTDEQKGLIQNRIDEMLSRAVSWHCAYEKDTSAKDYASRIYRHTHCSFYKFRNGKFRTYFVGGTNCVLLADELIRQKDLNLIRLNGFITPGTYLAFLNTEYLLKKGTVISRTVYTEH